MIHFCHNSSSVMILKVEFNFSSTPTMMDGFLDCLTGHDAQNKCVTFDSVLFSNCEEPFLSSVLLLHQKEMNQAVTDFLLSQTFHHLLGHTVPYSNRCCQFPVMSSFSLMSSLIFLLFRSVEQFVDDHNGADGQHLCFQHSNALPIICPASTHAGVSICILKLCVII